jgi:TonB family protein
MSFLMTAAAVVLCSVASIAQAALPAMSVISGQLSSEDTRQDLEFLRVGLPPAFGPAPIDGGGFSIGVYHADQKAPDLTPPVLFYAPDPVYPAGVQGRGEISVLLEFLVWLDGTPHSIRVVRSAGEQFDVAAVAAVKMWRYYPGAKAGRVWIFDATTEVTFVSHYPTHEKTFPSER